MRSKAWPRISVLGPHPYCRFRAATDVVMPDELATSASGIEGATWHGSWHEREDFLPRVTEGVETCHRCRQHARGCRSARRVPASGGGSAGSNPAGGT